MMPAKIEVRGNGSCDSWKGRVPLALGTLIVVSRSKHRGMLRALEK